MGTLLVMIMAAGPNPSTMNARAPGPLSSQVDTRPDLTILEAKYGMNNWIDITSWIRTKVVNKCLYLHVIDAYLEVGDPEPGVVKVLVLSYMLGNQTFTSQKFDGEVIFINPPPADPVCQAKLVRVRYGILGQGIADVTQQIRGYVIGCTLYWNNFSTYGATGVDPLPGIIKFLYVEYLDEMDQARQLAVPAEGNEVVPGWETTGSSKFTIQFSQTPTGDTDGDGLPDSWEMTYFGNLNQTGSSDPDGDGRTNAQEYAAGTDPTVPNTTPSNGAQFVSQSVPTSMTPGQSYSVSVTMENTGTTSWTDAGGYSLRSQNPDNNTTWGMYRVSLAAGESIAPSQQKTFAWTVTAPATAGTYSFQWRMRLSGVEWFGDLTPNVSVTVSATLPPTDTDADGLSDAWEMQYFGDLNQTGSGDPDADGYTNLQEYQGGSDPTNASSPGGGGSGGGGSGGCGATGLEALVVLGLLPSCGRLRPGGARHVPLRPQFRI